MIEKRVKAAVMVGPRKIEIKHFPYPELKKGGIILKIIMSGICGTDKHLYRGESVQYAGTTREIIGPYPSIPGHENIATIAEIDKNIKKTVEFSRQELKEGDRVIISPDILCGHCYYCKHYPEFPWCDNIKSYGHIDSTEPPHLFGGWAEYMYLLPGTQIHRVPDSIPDEIAVLLEPLAITYSLDLAKSHSALPNDGFMIGNTVVVLGVGPVGLCHTIKARLLGAGEIIVTDKSEFRLNMAKQFGANHTFNVEFLSESERIEAVKELTDGLGADVVVECTGYPQSVIEGLEMLRKGGTFIEVGNFVDTGTVEINPHRHLLSKNVRLIGSGNFMCLGLVPTMKLMKQSLNLYPFEKIITHTYKIEEAEKAIEKSMDLDSMKVVLSPSIGEV